MFDTMAVYHSKISYHLSYPEEYTDVDDGIIEFMEELCKIEEELLELETEVSNQPIGISGWTATNELRKLEAKQNELATEIREAYNAVHELKLNLFSRNPAEEYNQRTRNSAHQYQDDFDEFLQRLEKISSRASRRIDTKRNTANTRLILTVSVLAFVISTFSLIYNLY